MNPIPEIRDRLSMWGTAGTETSLYLSPPVKCNYFAWPGIIKEPVKPKPYYRGAGKIPNIQFAPLFIQNQLLKALRISYHALQSPGRKTDSVDSRCIFVWLCYKYSFTTGMGTISRLINRDRTTAIHMVVRANNAIITGRQSFIEKLQRAETKLLNQ